MPLLEAFSATVYGNICKMTKRFFFKGEGGVDVGLGILKNRGGEGCGICWIERSRQKDGFEIRTSSCVTGITYKNMKKYL